MEGLVGRALSHPLTRDLDLDSPETTAIRREIILSKPFLKEVYADWYRRIAERVPEGEGQILEIGAGGGFLDSVMTDVITSEVFYIENVSLVADAQELPVASGSLKAIVMTNVFHHLPDVGRFLSEAERTLRPGGRIIMVEPWNTWWSRFVHERFHSEPMLPHETAWTFPTTGPLSGANAALAWIVVERDRPVLESKWQLRVSETEPFMPLRYVVSGGVSLRTLQPAWMYRFWEALDDVPLLKNRQSVFALVVIQRTDDSD
jgi:SAM-dependent methyltransferase